MRTDIVRVSTSGRISVGAEGIEHGTLNQDRSEAGVIDLRQGHRIEILRASFENVGQLIIRFRFGQASVHFIISQGDGIPKPGPIP